MTLGENRSGEAPAIEEIDAPPEEKIETGLPWEFRVIAVACFWGLPGLLFGGLLRLLISDGGPESWWLVGGGILAAIAGGSLEAEHWT